jgi:ribonucleotide monophosphatase NagD (HAD superfamily)
MKVSEPSCIFVCPDRLYDGYVFDLDGTIYLGDELLPGAKRLILKLRELGKKVVFVSNNPTRDPKMYAEKLSKLGLHTSENEVVNTVVTMTQWLLQYHPEATVFPIQRSPSSVRSGRLVSGCRKEQKK